MIDYTIYYKSTLPIKEDWAKENSWDLFISAYNSSKRVNTVFSKANAKMKHWFILPDYQYKKNEWPSIGKVFHSDKGHESEFINEYFSKFHLNISTNSRICVDMTGFIKPYMMYLLKWFMEQGLEKLDVIFSEPEYYAKKEETKFSDEVVHEVRQVAGFEGSHITDTSNDVLVIGAGYDDILISKVAENKNDCRKILLFGFPSLRSDMYQENVQRVYRASEAVGVGPESNLNDYFAPANDPFVTASVLGEIIEKNSRKEKITNLYLCPLATKAQALGFTIYYLRECSDKPVSMLYPICHSHSQETSKGISRIWKYVIEFPK